jgi:hypothetical protein
VGLLKYVGFIKYEKVKVQRFLSGLPSFYKEKIQYDEPRTLTETIRKDKYLYEQGKGRESLQKYWKDKKKEKSDQRKKGFKPPFNRNSPNKNHPTSMLRMNPREKTPWEKGEDHQSNVGDAKKITCTRISLTERTK